MKNAAQHVREFKRLLKKIRRENAAPLPVIDDPMQQLLRGILTDYVSEPRAASALARLRSSIVDINELRVTPLAEIVEMLGTDLPMCRRAAEDIVKALNAVFNKLHHLDLSFLKKVARRTAESFLHNLDGVNEHARASVILRCIRGHAVPADVTMCEILRRENCVEPDASVEAIQKFLAAQIRESQAPSFYAQFKRYAANHVPKKMTLTPSQAIPLPGSPTAAPQPSAEPPRPIPAGKAPTATKSSSPAKATSGVRTSAPSTKSRTPSNAKSPAPVKARSIAKSSKRTRPSKRPPSRRTGGRSTRKSRSAAARSRRNPARNSRPAARNRHRNSRGPSKRRRHR